MKRIVTPNLPRRSSVSVSFASKSRDEYGSSSMRQSASADSMHDRRSRFSSPLESVYGSRVKSCFPKAVNAGSSPVTFQEAISFPTVSSVRCYSISWKRRILRHPENPASSVRRLARVDLPEPTRPRMIWIPSSKVMPSKDITKPPRNLLQISCAMPR